MTFNINGLGKNQYTNLMLDEEQKDAYVTESPKELANSLEQKADFSVGALSTETNKDSAFKNKSKDFSPEIQINADLVHIFSSDNTVKIDEAKIREIIRNKMPLNYAKLNFVDIDIFVGQSNKTTEPLKEVKVIGKLPHKNPELPVMMEEISKKHPVLAKEVSVSDREENVSILVYSKNELKIAIANSLNPKFSLEIREIEFFQDSLNFYALVYFLDEIFVA